MKMPYELQAAVSLEKRRANMIHSIGLGLPRLIPVPIENSKVINIACFGPSLKDTYKDLAHPIISMSGSTKFLVERGIIPDYHIDIDPRPHKVKFVIPPIPGITYLLASVCDPEYFNVLKDQNVILWHAVSSTEEEDAQWLAEHDRDSWVISTGSNVGLAAIQIGGFLGARHFEVHGMDGSFSQDLTRHSGEHFGKVQSPSVVQEVGGKTYFTSKVMFNGVVEAVNSARLFPIFTVFHGEGLVQALIEEEDLPNSCCAHQEEKCSKIRSSAIQFVDLPEDVPIKNIQSWAVWETIGVNSPNPSWLWDLQVQYSVAEKRRAIASLRTGSISLETGLLLKVLCNWYKPKVVVEVGTYIGKSTYSFLTDKVYTCDKDNDCVPMDERIVTYPKTSSTAMLKDLSEKGVKADLFFFDGRLSFQDIDLVLGLSNPNAIYVFDDYYENGKGVDNILKFSEKLPEYGLVEPYPKFSGRTTLAFMSPLKSI